MNFFKRALTSIQRRPGKTVILLLLVFILGTVISGAIAVEGAVSNTNRNLRHNLRPIVTFEEDWQARDEYIEANGLDWDDVPEEFLTPAMVREIGRLPYVEHYEYSIGTGLETTELTEYHFGMEDMDSGMFVRDSEMAWIPIRGTSESELLQVREGIFEIVDGRTFTDAEITAATDVHPVIVSSGFARVNDLSINDTFTVPIRVNLPHPDGSWDENWEASDESTFAEEVFEFQIIGLIDPVEEIDPSDWEARDRVENGLRTMHMPNVTVEAISNFQLDAMIEMFEYLGDEVDEWTQAWIERLREQDELPVTSVMVLNDALDIDAFREEAMELLPAFWRVLDMSNAFNDISTSMESLQNIATWVLRVAIGATLLILSLLITLFLRDRRHEMGVYLALGEKKGRIVSQILLEVTMTAVIGITLAVFTGNMISGAMSRNMLRNELAAQQEDNHFHMEWNEFNNLGLNQTMSHDDMLEAFDTSPTLGTIGLFYVVGLGAVIFSTIAPVMYVVALNPKKVLM